MKSLCVIALNEEMAQSTHFQSIIRSLDSNAVVLSERQFLGGTSLPPNPHFLFLLSKSHLLKPDVHRAVALHLQQYDYAINLCVIDGIDVAQCAQVYQLFHDFLLWPCTASEITARLNRFAPLPARPGNHELDEKLLAQFAELNLVGNSDSFRQTLSLIKKVARCDAPVLIRGETGTGKENAARAIHYLGTRSDYGFVPVNCGALPDELLESELFGYQKGAFTDAKENQPGLVKIAQGGTLFLDEIDSLSPKAQAALLRFLQTREYRPVGGKQTFHADVRVIAATNADLTQRVASGAFREDLVFRLNVLLVTMPPLRERIEDIPVIATKLLTNFCGQYGIKHKRLTPASQLWLSHQRWPGNVRELENVLLRHALLCDDELLHIGDATVESRHNPTSDTEAANYSVDLSTCFQQAKTDAIYRFEQNYLRQIMLRADGNVTEAARISGKERRSLGKLLKKYKIDKREYLRDFSAM